MIAATYCGYCTCGGSTNSTSDIVATSHYTVGSHCDYCQQDIYYYAVAADEPCQDAEGPEELIVWDFVRGILYVILRLRQYVEAVARPPPIPP
jgi:hypothetical protein